MKNILLYAFLFLSAAAGAQTTLRNIPLKSTASFNDTLLVQNGTTQTVKASALATLIQTGYLTTASAAATYQAKGSYLTSYTETDPVFLAHVANSITSTNITNWNSAFSWGNHASAGYLTNTTGDGRYYTKTLADARYLQSFTELDPKRIVSIAVTGTGTKTITATLADASTVTTTFPDLQGTGGTGSNNPDSLANHPAAYYASAASLAAHTSNTSNPHSVTATQVGLGNVTNTSDASKPVSTAQQTALDLKVDKVTGKQLSTEDYSTPEKTKLAGIATGATNVTNNNQLTNGADYATNTALALKAPIANPTFTGTVKLNNGSDTAATKADVRAGTGSSGSSFPTQQSHTSGTTVTVTSQTTDIWLLVNPASTLATLSVTTPATPVDGQKLEISFGGTMTTGTVVTSLTVTANTSQTILQASSPTSILAGETISYRFKSSNSVWYRII